MLNANIVYYIIYTKSGLILPIRALPNIIDMIIDDHEEGLLGIRVVSS